jgi:hypothetical protein
MYRFEWYYGIKDQTTFNEFVENSKVVESLVNYEQGARLFYEGKNGTVMIELQIPTNDTCQSGSMGSWIWVVDYQQAAHILQNELYGTSNITLEDGRTTLIDIYNGTAGSGGSSSSSTSKPLEKEEVSTTENTTVPDEILEEELTEEDMDVPEMEETEEFEEESTTENIDEPVTEETEDDIEDTTLVTIGDDQ